MEVQEFLGVTDAEVSQQAGKFFVTSNFNVSSSKGAGSRILGDTSIRMGRRSCQKS